MKFPLIDGDKYPSFESESVLYARKMDRLNPNGGSVAIGHPFGVTGTRDLSQATKELAAMPAGARAVVSVCADGGLGTVALLEVA